MLLKMVRNRLLVLLMCLAGFMVHAQMPPAVVHVEKAKIQELAPTTWFAGTVVSQNNAEIAAEVSGRLLELARIGQRVSKGALIARIDDEPLKLKQQELVAAVKSARYRLNFLQSEVDRLRSLSGRNMTAKNELDRTISERDIANENLLAAEARLAQTEKQLQFTVLKAPFDGVITERLSQKGELVNAGTAVARLVETENLEITTRIPLTSFGFVKTGDSLAVKSALGNAGLIVNTLVPVAGERSHQMEIRLALGDHQWPVGLDVRVAVPITEASPVLTVPRDALVLRREGTSVFRIKDDKTAEQIPVTVGRGQGAIIEIIGEINEGEQIVIRGAERLRPGQTVSINENNDQLVPL